MKQVILLLFLLTYIVSGDTLSCTDIKTTYNNKECCSNLSADTCLRSIPACTDTSVVAGQICTDPNGNAIMKDLSSLTPPALTLVTAAPTSSTLCEVGDMQLHHTTNPQKVYVCVSTDANAGVYNWRWWTTSQ